MRFQRRQHALLSGFLSLSAAPRSHSLIRSSQPRSALRSLRGADLECGFSTSLRLLDDGNGYRRDKGNANPKRTIFKNVQQTPRLAVSATGLSLQKDLAHERSDPVQLLRQQLEDRTATVETVRICLQAYSTRLTRRPRSQRVQAIKDEKVGPLVLHWLWSEDMRWTGAVTRDTDFLDSLMYCVAAENLDDFVIGWLGQEMPVEVGAQLGRGASNQWRGGVFRALVNAHLWLDFSFSADPALELFFKVVTKAVAARRAGAQSPIGLTGLHPASIALTKALRGSLFRATSPELYQKFTRWMDDDSSHRRDDMDIAALYLNHPTQPDAAPALAVLHRAMRDSSSNGELDALSGDKRAKENVLFFMRRTIRLLQKEGHKQDAEWVAQCVERSFSSQEVEAVEAKEQRETQRSRASRKTNFEGHTMLRDGRSAHNGDRPDT